ncbi:MAG: CBU_0592 family membrane protein [Actinomycetota bacterium]
MEQTVQIVGALLILTAFVLAQRKTLDTASPVYLVLNLVGAVVLAIVAALDSDWGFVLLEGVWALVSAAALVGRIRTRGTSP